MSILTSEETKMMTLRLTATTRVRRFWGNYTVPLTSGRYSNMLSIDHCIRTSVASQRLSTRCGSMFSGNVLFFSGNITASGQDTFVPCK